MNTRDHIELSFERWGQIAFHHRWKVILAMAILTVALCAGLSYLRTDVSTESYLQKGDPARLVYDDFRARFGNDEDILLIVEGEDIFARSFVEKLRALHQDLEENVPSIDEVDSLINARVTRGEGDTLIVEDLFESWPATAAEQAAIETRARATQSYQNLLFSQDARYTTVRLLILPAGDAEPDALDSFDDDFETGPAEGQTPPPATMLQGEELDRVAEGLFEVVERHRSEDFRISVAGGPPMVYELIQIMNHDMALFTGLSNALIAILLFSLFRRFSGVLLPLTVVMLPLAATFGAMGYLDLPITGTSQILPSLLLAVCVGDAVHLLSSFYDKYDRGVSKEDAISFALGHSGLAVVMTSLTTAGSLFSFAFADLEPLRGLGLAAPIGILFALLYAVVLLPPLIAICPIRPRALKGVDGRAGVIDRVLVSLGDFSTQRPWLVVGMWSMLILASLFGASKLSFTHAPHLWFPEDHAVRRAISVANEVFEGALSLEVILDSGEENGLHDPELLRRIEELHRVAESADDGVVRIGKTISLVDVIKETHQALNGNDEAYYVLPDDRQLIAQELLLFENAGSEDLEKLVDSQFRTARLTLMAPFEDAIHYQGFIEGLRGEFEKTLDGAAEVELTGLIVLYGRTLAAILSSTAKSYTIAIATIIPLMILLIGNLRMGLLSLIPNLAPILIGMGFMGVIGVKLDFFTIMIGAIAIGVAVDDTIHFMHNYRRYYERTGNSQLAVHETLRTAGRALFVTSLALSAGFFVFLFATMRHVVGFGLVTGFTILVALLADLMLSPALVTLADRFSKRSHS